MHRVPCFEYVINNSRYTPMRCQQGQIGSNAAVCIDLTENSVFTHNWLKNVNKNDKQHNYYNILSGIPL